MERIIIHGKFWLSNDFATIDMTGVRIQELPAAKGGGVELVMPTEEQTLALVRQLVIIGKSFSYSFNGGSE